MKALGIVLLIIGFLAVVIGLVVVIGSQVASNDECVLADKYRQEAEQLARDADVSRGTPKQAELQAKATEKMHIAATWAEGCASRRKLHTIAAIVGVIVFAVGIVMAVSAFLIFRNRKRTSA